MGWLNRSGCSQYVVAAEMPYAKFANATMEGRLAATDAGLVYEYWRNVGGVWTRQYQTPMPVLASECLPGELAADYWSLAWAVVVVCVVAFGVNHCLRRFVGS